VIVVSDRYVLYSRAGSQETLHVFKEPGLPKMSDGVDLK
jgi:hypothetical protein